MKIVFLDKDTLGDVDNLSILEKLGDVKMYPKTSESQKIERSKDAQILILNKVLADKALIDSCPNLQLICLAATGMNNVDLPYAASKGIQVKNVSGYSTYSVAQFTFALLLDFLHPIRFYDQFVKSGEYTNHPMFCNLEQTFFELRRKRFGIIGLGNIGNQVAIIAEAFGCEVVYYSTTGKNNHARYTRLALDELLKTSDIVSIHAPLNDVTKDLLNESNIKLMKSTAILMNLGRGGIVNELAVTKAIDEDRIGGAIIDVFSKEPMDSGSPFLQVKNKHKLLLTPHVAWASIEARRLLVEKIAENIKTFLI